MSNLNVNNLTSLAGNNGTIGVSSSLNVSGSITLTGNVTANGNIVLGDSTGDSVSLGADISSSLIPDATATYDLGTMAKAWRNLHAHGLGHIHTASLNLVSSSLIPAVDDASDLGSSLRQWKDLYIDGVAFIDSASIQGLISSLIPDADNARDLGSNTKQWRNLYIDGKAFIDEISGSSLSGADSALTASVDIVPGGMLIESIYDLGSSTRRWKDLYIKNVEFGNNISLTRDGSKGVSLEGALSVTKAITASSARFASMSTTNHPQNLGAFESGDLYFMSGSQIFTGSAFQPGHADQIFTSPSFSSSIFVFKK